MHKIIYCARELRNLASFSFDLRPVVGKLGFTKALKPRINVMKRRITGNEVAAQTLLKLQI